MLVLDGLEKVQDDGARGGRLGHITDASLRQLLLDLGEGYLHGVSAIITTRFLLDDLEVAEGPYYRAADVERIAVPACIELLRRRGVHGADTALEAIAEACGRHALTVDLIGGYLAAFKGGAPLLALARIASGAPSSFPLPVRKAQPPKPAAPQPAPLVFVCYARADNEPPHRWLDRLLEMIEPLNKRSVVQTWTDHAISIGERWDTEIQRSLATARAAVLLVSPAFLASKYIHNSELPVLLRRAQNERSLRIFPVLLRPSLFHVLPFRYPDPVHGPDEMKLADFQVANPPSRTLSEMTQPEQDRVLLDVARALLQLAAG